MNMPTLSIIFGLLLNVLGLVVFVATGSVHKTALIPCIFGIILFLAGLAAAVSPKSRMHLMHVAALTALIGTLGGFGMSLPKLPGLVAGEAARPFAVWEQLGMGVLCMVFLILCVKSFIAARRARKDS